jgi:hypothetical protein
MMMSMLFLIRSVDVIRDFDHVIVLLEQEQGQEDQEHIK